MTTARRKPGSKNFETGEEEIVSEEKILGEKEDDFEEIRGYGLTRADVAQMLGKSSFFVRQLEKQKKLHPRTDKTTGYNYFDPKEVEQLVEELDKDREIEKEVNNSGEIVRAGTSLTKVAVSHLESILKLAHQPATEVMQLLIKENQGLRGDREVIYGRYFELLEKLEDVLQNHHERQLAREEAVMRNARNERLVEMVAEHAPMILQNFVARDDNPITKLVRSLSTEQLQSLRELKFVDEEQFALIEKIRGQNGERLQEKP